MISSLPQWESNTWVAIGTLALAGVTLLLAAVTAAQVRTSRRALEASLRPLLVDVPLGGEEDAEADVTSDEKGVVEIEVPLRNAGTGLALVVGGPRLQWEAFPPPGWSGVSQQLVVMPGERVRLTFRQAFGSAESANEVALSAKKFSVAVDYTDVNGKQWTRTKAYVIEHPDENADVGLYVDRIELSDRTLFSRVKQKPFVSLSGRANS